MKITFLGATHEVTGSMSMISVGNHNILIDCGMQQGRDIFENAELPVSPEKIDCLLLTHAHIDHTGKVPLLFKNGFEGKVYCTNETAMLCKIMLADSAHIQKTEADWKNRKAKRSAKNLIEPMYDINDVNGVLQLFHPLDYDVQTQILEGVRIRFSDIGHLLGSAAIEIWLEEGGNEKKIVFSGDVGNTNQPIIKDPLPIKQTDYLVIESTYGNRLHEHPENLNSVEFLASCIQKTFDRGGNVVIPSFAVGRTQEMLYFLRKIKEQKLVHGHDGFKVFVDSPLANEATDIFLQCSNVCLDTEARALVDKGINPIFFDGLTVSISTDESKAINFIDEPKVIISASGMCEAGRIRHHLKHNLWREESLILFVGFQAEGTLGRMLFNGEKNIKLFGEDIAVKAEVALLPGMSGHADKDGLVNWINAFEKKPEFVFVNHGEDESVKSFAQLCQEQLGLNSDAPYSGSVFDMITGSYETEKEGVLIPQKEKQSFAQTDYNALMEKMNRLMEAARSTKGRANSELKKLSGQVERLLKEFS